MLDALLKVIATMPTLFVSMCSNETYPLHEEEAYSLWQAELQTASASTPTDHHHVQIAKERKKNQALQSRVTQTSCTLDYKAAVLLGNSGAPIICSM